jgi:hypothetical protein
MPARLMHYATVRFGVARQPPRGSTARQTRAAAEVSAAGGPDVAAAAPLGTGRQVVEVGGYLIVTFTSAVVQQH